MVNDPDESTTFDSALENAKEIFQKLYPDLPFLPEQQEIENEETN